MKNDIFKIESENHTMENTAQPSASFPSQNKILILLIMIFLIISTGLALKMMTFLQRPPIKKSNNPKMVFSQKISFTKKSEDVELKAMPGLKTGKNDHTHSESDNTARTQITISDENKKSSIPSPDDADSNMINSETNNRVQNKVGIELKSSDHERIEIKTAIEPTRDKKDPKIDLDPIEDTDKSPSKTEKEILTAGPNKFEIPNLMNLIQKSAYDEAADIFYKKTKAYPNAYSISLEVDCLIDSVDFAFQKGGYHQNIFLLPRKISGRNCYALFWGLYSTIDEANSSLVKVPPFFKKQSSALRIVPINQYFSK